MNLLHYLVPDLATWLDERHLAVNVLFKVRGDFTASTFPGPLGVLC